MLVVFATMLSTLGEFIIQSQRLFSKTHDRGYRPHAMLVTPSSASIVRHSAETTARHDRAGTDQRFNSLHETSPMLWMGGRTHL
jgi:hypothetical protein